MLVLLYSSTMISNEYKRSSTITRWSSVLVVLDSPIETFCHHRNFFCTVILFCNFFLWQWHHDTDSLSLTLSLFSHSLSTLFHYLFIIFCKFVFISSKVFTPILSLFTLTGLQITIRTSGAEDGQLDIFMIV